MRRTLMALLAALLLLTPSLAHAVAESCTESDPVNACGDVFYVDIDCTADSADASFDTQITTKSYCGYIHAVETDPGSTGPTDNSDLDLYHTVGGAAAAEMLGAQGDDILDNATNNHVTLTTKVMACGPLGIDMQNNIVNSANFRLRIYFEIPGRD